MRTVLVFLLFLISACDEQGDKPSASCGDGTVQNQELCDGADLAGASCTTLG